MAATRPAEKIALRFVVFQEGDLWVGQCVEYDIAAHASDLTRLEAALERAVMQNVCVNHELGREGLDGVPLAPERFRTLFDAPTGYRIQPVEDERRGPDGSEGSVAEMRVVARAA